jgi:hypothetical protein
MLDFPPYNNLPTTPCPDLWECKLNHLPPAIHNSIMYDGKVYIPNTFKNYNIMWDYCYAVKGADIDRDYRRVYKFLLGHWKCINSPYGVCVYDMASNMRDDSCVICGQPDERK